jgi:hypothetical protein
VEIVMRCIVNACMMARTSFSEPEEVHRFWRYLNLQHLIAYCGLTDGYNIDNFFGPLVEKYSLLGDEREREEERAYLSTVDVDAEGLRACAMYEVWTLEIAHAQAAMTPLFTPPVHAQLNAEVLNVGNSIKRLYAYSYQVLHFPLSRAT